MRILFLSHCVPYPPDKGDKVRAFHQIRWLSQKHDVHLLAIAKTREDLQYRSELEQWCTEVELFPLDKNRARIQAAACLWHQSRPMTHAYFWSPALARRVTSILRESPPPDMIFAYTAAMGPYAEIRDPPIGPAAIDLVDIDSAKWAHYSRSRAAPLKWIFSAEAKRLQHYERSVSESFDAVFVTTERERTSLTSLSPESRPIVVRNGVDTDFFSIDSGKKSPEPKIVFTGQMDYYPNEDAVLALSEGVFPELRNRYPKLTLDVVGRSPGPAVVRLGAIPGIEVTGEVPDIRPYLEAAWIFAAPLRIARGVQNKVLEAAAFELPIVCTSEVFKGLTDGGFRDGEHLLVADDHQDFIDAISRLVDDRELRVSLGAKAKQLLSTNYSWDENMRQLELGIEGCIAADGTATRQARG